MEKAQGHEVPAAALIGLRTQIAHFGHVLLAK